jgi:hypothetical protein
MHDYFCPTNLLQEKRIPFGVLLSPEENKLVYLWMCSARATCTSFHIVETMSICGCIQSENG